MQHLRATDLWSAYFKEREGFETIYSDHAVATYRIIGEECYLKDIFVHPDYRNTKQGSELADKVAQIAKENGCKYLTGSVVPSTNGATLSLYAMIKYGFVLKQSSNDFIILVKEI